VISNMCPTFIAFWFSFSARLSVFISATAEKIVRIRKVNLFKLVIPALRNFLWHDSLRVHIR